MSREIDGIWNKDLRDIRNSHNPHKYGLVIAAWDAKKEFLALSTSWKQPHAMEKLRL